MPFNGKNELERFVNKYGFDKIWAAITGRLLDGSGDFIDDGCVNFTPEDMFLKFTRNLTVDDCCFLFDAVFEVYASFTAEYGEDRYQSQWLAVHCAAEVDDTLKTFEVAGIDIYTKTRKRGDATQNFVPVISKRQMAAEATRFLRQNYPEALRKATRVPMYEIACSLGLNVELGYMLSDDFSFFGQISFSDTVTRVFDILDG